MSLEIPPAIISAPPATAASKILALIEGEEGKYQVSLNETYQEMGEKTFKGLRRALPLTRQKLDWDKVRSSLLALSNRLFMTISCLGYGLQIRRRAIRYKESPPWLMKRIMFVQ